MNLQKTKSERFIKLRKTASCLLSCCCLFQKSNINKVVPYTDEDEREHDQVGQCVPLTEHATVAPHAGMEAKLMNTAWEDDIWVQQARASLHAHTPAKIAMSKSWDDIPFLLKHAKVFPRSSLITEPPKCMSSLDVFAQSMAPGLINSESLENDASFTHDAREVPYSQKKWKSFDDIPKLPQRSQAGPHSDTHQGTGQWKYFRQIPEFHQHGQAGPHSDIHQGTGQWKSFQQIPEFPQHGQAGPQCDTLGEGQKWKSVDIPPFIQHGQAAPYSDTCTLRKRWKSSEDLASTGNDSFSLPSVKFNPTKNTDKLMKKESDRYSPEPSTSKAQCHEEHSSWIEQFSRKDSPAALEDLKFNLLSSSELGDERRKIGSEIEIAEDKYVALMKVLNVLERDRETLHVDKVTGINSTSQLYQPKDEQDYKKIKRDLTNRIKEVQETQSH